MCKYQQHIGACVIVQHIHSRREREEALQSYSFYKKQPIRSFYAKKQWESLSTYNQRKLKKQVFHHYLWKYRFKGAETTQFKSLLPPKWRLDKVTVTRNPTVCILWQLPAHVSVYSHITVSGNAASNDFPATCGRRTKVQHACTLHENTRSRPLLVGIVYIHHRTLTIRHTSGLNPPPPPSFVYHSQHSADCPMSMDFYSILSQTRTA